MNGSPRFEDEITRTICPQPPLTLADWHQALIDLDENLRDDSGQNFIRVVRVEGRIAFIRLRADLRHKEK